MNQGAQTVSGIEDWQPGDEFGTIWPSDTPRNLSADARVLARGASDAFRKALGLPPRTTTKDPTDGR